MTKNSFDVNTFANGERLRLSKACRSPALTWEHYGRKLFQDFIGNFPIGFYHAHFLKVLSLEQNMQTEIHLHCSVPSQQLVVKVDTNLWYCVVSCLVWFYWNSFDSFGFLSLVLYCVVCNYSFLFKIWQSKIIWFISILLVSLSIICCLIHMLCWIHLSRFPHYCVLWSNLCVTHTHIAATGIALNIGTSGQYFRGACYGLLWCAKALQTWYYQN